MVVPRVRQGTTCITVRSGPGLERHSHIYKMIFSKNKYNILPYVKPPKCTVHGGRNMSTWFHVKKMAQKFYLSVKQIGMAARQVSTLIE